MIKNFFAFEYTEKGAINGHSVDRYQYARSLIKKGGDADLIKAYAWLSLASDEVDMKVEASRLKYQLSYQLKLRDLYLSASKCEQNYRNLYSAEAYRKMLNNSKNPFKIFIAKSLNIIEKFLSLEN